MLIGEGGEWHAIVDFIRVYNAPVRTMLFRRNENNSAVSIFCCFILAETVFTGPHMTCWSLQYVDGPFHSIRQVRLNDHVSL